MSFASCQTCPASHSTTCTVGRYLILIRGVLTRARVSVRMVGNSAPMECNLVRYLSKHPECEVYCGQDAGRPGTGGADGGVLRRVEAAANAPPTASSAARPRRVALWHKLQKRKVVGNAAPLEKNVASCEPAPRRVQLARWPAGRAGRSAAAGRI